MQAKGFGGWGVEPSTRVGGSRRAQSGSLGCVAPLVQRFYLSGLQFVGEVALGKGLAFSRGCGEVDPFLGCETAVKEGGRPFCRVPALNAAGACVAALRRPRPPAEVLRQACCKATVNPA